MKLFSPHGLKKEAVLATFALGISSYCCFTSFELLHVFANFRKLGRILWLSLWMDLSDLLTEVSYSFFCQFRKIGLLQRLWLEWLRTIEHCCTWNSRIRQTIACFRLDAVISTGLS